MTCTVKSTLEDYATNPRIFCACCVSGHPSVPVLTTQGANGVTTSMIVWTQDISDTVDSNTTSAGATLGPALVHRLHYADSSTKSYTVTNLRPDIHYLVVRVVATPMKYFFLGRLQEGVFFYSIVLFPLLGLTWLFCLMSVGYLYRDQNEMVKN